MTLGSLVLFGFIIYLLFVVGKTVWSNYKSNQEIDKEESKLAQQERSLVDLQNQINYYKTSEFKEKEARAKLGYKAPGENVMSLPIDTEEEKVADSGTVEAKIKVPNYSLWWDYFTK